MASAIPLPPDGPEFGALLEALADRLAAKMKTPVPPASSAPLDQQAAYFSVGTLRKRWDASESSVYRIIRQMEKGGYLECLYIGTDRRIALRSVETWERLHTRAPLKGRALPVASVHEPSERRRPGRPRKKAPPPPKEGGAPPSIRELARRAAEGAA